jgi:hypothetical protein
MSPFLFIFGNGHNFEYIFSASLSSSTFFCQVQKEIMSTTHELALHFSEGTDPRFLRISDASCYVDGVDIECGHLEITPPGFSIPAIYDVKEGFNLIVNASNMGLTKITTVSQLPNLSDGIYCIKYSIKPNAKIWVEYQYLRNQNQTKRYLGEICRLFKQRAIISPDEFQIRRAQLVWIKELIDAAKYTVEDLHDNANGIKLYNEANQLLLKLNGLSKC